MPLLYRYLFPALWLSWIAYWWISSKDVKPTLRHEALTSRLSHIAPLVIVGLLLAMPKVPVPVLRERFMPLSGFTFAIGAAITVVGLVFSVWARRRLGRNWSGT